jgi:AraC-like DNA-binding protein
LEICEWTRAEKFEDFALVCCGRPHLNLLSDPDAFSMMQRVARMGSVVVSEFVVGSDVAMECGEVCNSYRILLLQAGRTEAVHRGRTVSAGPGTAAVYAPDGLSMARWTAGSRMICLKINRRAVDDALSDALGWQAPAQVDFTPILPMTAAPTRSWINMLLHFKDQIFRPDSLVNQPMAGLPFVDSLVRGFLLAADHSQRDALVGDQRRAAPRAIRTAIEVIEEEAHLPLTVSSIATRCHVSVRSLQQGFRRHTGMTPMTYLREVRLRRAHQTLLESDPSTSSVASVASHWGFTNLGRFAAAHTARYDETPAVTLRRRTFRRLQPSR